eukprot:NODE_260_length_12610_cov_0.413076.p2 type:complete len:301 gc:universal NODE_260_length_12610_cov_0.413076:10340-9438(-)
MSELKNLKNGLKDLFAPLNQSKPATENFKNSKTALTPKNRILGHPQATSRKVKNNLLDDFDSRNTKKRPSAKKKSVSNTDKQLWAALNGKKVDKPIIQSTVNKKELIRQLELGNLLPEPKVGKSTKLDDEEDYEYYSDDEIKVEKVQDFQKSNNKNSNDLKILPKNKRTKVIPNYKFKDRPSRITAPVVSGQRIGNQTSLSTSNENRAKLSKRPYAEHDEVEGEINYSDVIQELFGNRRYQYDDYDDDDMEATAADIKREEIRRYSTINKVRDMVNRRMSERKNWSDSKSAKEGNDHAIK